MLFLALPISGYAYEAEYYTYNGFQETVDAFTRISFIFNDTDYSSLFYTAAILGVVIGGIAVFGKGLAGQKVNPLAWLLPIMFGVLVYQALIIPKDKIHIYDDVLNAYQAVNGVPDGIILMASLLNKVERIFIDIVDTNTVNPWADYEAEAGGISFKLIQKATGQYIDVQDAYLTKSIKQYYNDCGILSLGIPGSTVTLNELRRGTTDMLATLEKMNSPALSTKYYTPAAKSGNLVTCQAAWTSIKVLLTNVTTWNEPTNAVCAKAGFNPGDANQITKCKIQLAKAQEVYGLVGGSAVNFIRNSYLSNTILEETMSGSQDTAQTMLANRNIMMQGIGSGAMINEWMPRIRAWMLTIILGLTPLISIFIITPLFSKAAMLLGGMLIWFTTWSIIDIVMHGGAVDASWRAFEQIQDFQMGLDAIWLSPEASVQSLGVFGQSRLVALGLSGAIVAALFKLSIGSSIASAGSNVAGSIYSQGGQSASTVATSEGQGTLTMRSTDGLSAAVNHGLHGTDGMVSSSAYSESTGINSNKTQINSGMAQDHNIGTLSEKVGAMNTMPVDKVTAASNILKMYGKDANTENIQALQSGVNEINATKGLTEPGAYRNALSRVFGKDVLSDDDAFMQAAIFQQTFGNLDSVNSAASLDKTARTIGDEVYDKTGKYPSQPVIMDNLRSFQHGNTIGQINAMEGDGGAWEQHQTNSHIKSTAMLGAEVGAFEDNNISAKVAYQAQGQKSAAENIGLAKTLSEYGLQPFMLAAQKDESMKLSEANAWNDHLVNDVFKGNVKDTQDFMALPNVAENYAKAARINWVANTFFDGDVYKATSALGSTDEQFTIAAEKIREFANNNPGQFSKEQLDIINDADYMSIRLNHDGEGNFSNIQGYSGTDMEQHKSSTMDLSHTENAGSRLYDNTIREALMGNNSDSFDLAQNTVIKNRTDPEYRSSFMAEWTEEIEKYATANSVDTTSLSIQGRVGVGGEMESNEGSRKGGIIGQVADMIGLKVTGEAEAGKQWTDHTYFNTTRSALEQTYTSLETESWEYAQQASNNLTQQQEIFANTFASRLRSFNDGLVNEISTRSVDDADGNAMMSIADSAEDNKTGKIIR